ncbi:MAG: serine hydrolase [bacterium]|nr:serine hydrolase [bacterium]
MKPRMTHIFFMFLLVPCLLFADDSRLDSLLLAISAKYQLAGMSVTVIKDTSVVFSRGYGLRDIGRNLATNNKTAYRIASISKMVTATAIMQLYEQRLFKLDDDVSSYIGFNLRNPKFPDQPITFKMLLSHTSSLRDGSGYDRFLSDSYSKTPPPAIRELLISGGSYYTSDMFDGNRAPNQKYFQYANINFGVLGTLVENLSGERFDIYCKKHIFETLGMNSSFNVLDLPDINDVAVLYRKSGGIWTAQADQYNGTYPAERDLSGYKIGDNGIIFAPQGGLRSSSLDLAKFMLAHQFGGSYRQTRMLNDTTVARMHSLVWNYNGSNGNNYYGIFNTYALGNHTTTDLLRGKNLIGHPGEAYGLISDLYFSKQENFGIIFMTNGGSWGYGSYSGWYNVEEEVFNACFSELSSLTASVKNSSEVFMSHSLEQNYPNPFNPTTQIRYQIARAEKVDLILYNLLGERVAQLVNEQQNPGSYEINFNASNLAAGVYLYQLKAGNFSAAKKLLVVK